MKINKPLITWLLGITILVATGYLWSQAGGQFVSGGGNGNATSVNGASVPASATFIGTNASNQFVDATSSATALPAQLGELCQTSSGVLGACTTVQHPVTVGTGGTTATYIVKRVTDGYTDATAQTDPILGIASSTGTVGTTILLVRSGKTTCTAEGTVTNLHYLVEGSTTKGKALDSGQTALTAISSSTPVLGIALATATNATFDCLVFPTYGSKPNVANATGTLPATSMPVPSASTLGGIESITCSAGQHINDISTSGVPSCTADSGGSGYSQVTRVSNQTTVALTSSAYKDLTGASVAIAAGKISATGGVRVRVSWHGTAGTKAFYIAVCWSPASPTADTCDGTGFVLYDSAQTTGTALTDRQDGFLILNTSDAAHQQIKEDITPTMGTTLVAGAAVNTAATVNTAAATNVKLLGHCAATCDVSALIDNMTVEVF